MLEDVDVLCDDTGRGGGGCARAAAGAEVVADDRLDWRGVLVAGGGGDGLDLRRREMSSLAVVTVKGACSMSAMMVREGENKTLSEDMSCRVRYLWR